MSGIEVTWKARFQQFLLRRKPFAQDAFELAPPKAKVFLDIIDAELAEEEPDMEFVEYLEEQQFVLITIANTIADVRGEDEISWRSLEEACREFRIEYESEDAEYSSALEQGETPCGQVEIIEEEEMEETELMSVEELAEMIVDAYMPVEESSSDSAPQVIGDVIVTYIPSEPDWRAYQ